MSFIRRPAALTGAAFNRFAYLTRSSSSATPLKRSGARQPGPLEVSPP